MARVQHAATRCDDHSCLQCIAQRAVLTDYRDVYLIDSTPWMIINKALYYEGQYDVVEWTTGEEYEHYNEHPEEDIQLRPSHYHWYLPGSPGTPGRFLSDDQAPEGWTRLHSSETRWAGVYGWFEREGYQPTFRASGERLDPGEVYMPRYGGDRNTLLPQPDSERPIDSDGVAEALDSQLGAGEARLCECPTCAGVATSDAARVVTRDNTSVSVGAQPDDRRTAKAKRLP